VAFGKNGLFPSFFSEGPHFCQHLLEVEGALENFKTTSDSSSRTDLSNKITSSQSQSHAIFPYKFGFPAKKRLTYLVL
jgi:hypothetical protein